MGEQDSAFRMGQINYLGPHEGTPSFHAYDGSKDNMPLDRRKIRIQDARGLQPPPTVDLEGFEVCDFPSELDDFNNLELVNTVYAKEVEQFIKQKTNATQIVVSTIGGTRSCKKDDQRDLPPVQRPVQFVHTDFSDDGAWWWASRFLNNEDINKAKHGRFSIYNIWRSVSAPPQNVPLAICDARSFSLADQVCCDAVSDFPGNQEIRWPATLFKYSSSHRWYFFSNMLREEVLLFKAYDSDSSHSIRTPHTAFTDTQCSANTPPRESIECRVFTFFY